MYSILRAAGRSAVLWRELPALGASFVIAELFYKFHSFTLECLAFLVTWTFFGWLGEVLFGRPRAQ